MQPDPLYHATAAEVRAGRRWRRVRRWWARVVRLAQRCAKWARELSDNVKTIAGLVTAIAALWGALRTPVRWLGRLYHARDAGRAELPANGVPSTALDFLGPGYRPPGE